MTLFQVSNNVQVIKKSSHLPIIIHVSGMASQVDKPQQAKKSLTSRIATALRPKKNSRLAKTVPDVPVSVEQDQLSPSSLFIQRDVATHKTPGEPPPVNFFNKGPSTVNAQTGEVWDEAEMLHSLLRRDSHDSLESLNKLVRMRNQIPDPMRKPGEKLIASLPSPIWGEIANHSSPTDAANLALSSKTLLSLLGTKPFLALNFTKNETESHQHKINFLLGMDKILPDHVSLLINGINYLEI